MSRKNFLLCVMIVSVLAIVSAMDSLAAEKVFKVGIIAPLTGPIAKLGNEVKDGIVMGVEKSGSKIGDYKIELVYIDDQSDPSKGTSGISEAIERLGIQAAIGPVNTAVAVAVQDVIAKYKVPLFFTTGNGYATNEKWASLPPENRYLVSKGMPLISKLGVVYIDCLNGAIDRKVWKPEKKLVAFWAEDSDWGRHFIHPIAITMKEKGWKVFTEEYFAFTKTDFYPFLNKCKQAGVTVLWGGSSALSSISAFVKQKTEIQMKALVVADGLGYTGEWYKLVGPDSDGILDMQAVISTPAHKAWAKEFESRFGYAPGAGGAGMNYDLGCFFVKIAKRTVDKYGKLDAEAIYKVGRDEVRTGKLTYSSADGALFNKRYRYTSESTPDPVVGQKDFYWPVIQYKGGKGYVVFPEDLKEANFMVP